MRQGRWTTSQAMRGYIQEGELFVDNPAAKLGMQRPRDHGNTGGKAAENRSSRTIVNRFAYSPSLLLPQGVAGLLHPVAGAGWDAWQDEKYWRGEPTSGLDTPTTHSGLTDLRDHHLGVV
jgi:hypothetical protein